MTPGGPLPTPGVINPDEILPGKSLIIPDGIFEDDVEPFARDYPGWLYKINRDGRREFSPPATPSKANFDAWIQDDVNRYGDLLWRFRRDLRLYRRRTGGVPLGFDPDQDQAYTTAEIGIQVQKMCAMIASTPVSINYPNRSRSEREDAQAMEAWARWFFEEISRHHRTQNNTGLINDLVWYACVYGRVAVQVRPDTSDNRFPWNVSVEDPATCFPLAGSGKYGLARMSRQYTAYAQEVCDAFYDIAPDLKDKIFKRRREAGEDFDMDREVEVTECDTRWSRYIAVEGVEVIRTDHEYGYVPYIYGLGPGEAGTASNPVAVDTGFDGRYREAPFDRRDDVIWDSTGRSFDIIEKGVSFFHNAIPAILHLEELYALLHLGLVQTKFPAMLTTSIYNQPPEPIDLSPGAHNLHREGETSAPVIPHPSPADIQPLIAARQAEVGKALLPPNFFGQNDGESNITGFTQDSMLAAAKDRVQPYYDLIQNTVSDVIFMASSQFHDFGHLTYGLSSGELIIPRYNRKADFTQGNKAPAMPDWAKEILAAAMQKTTAPGGPLGPPLPPPPPPMPEIPAGPQNPFRQAGAATPPAIGVNGAPPPGGAAPLPPMGGAQPPAMMPPMGGPPPMMGPPPGPGIGTPGFVKPEWTMTQKPPAGDMPEFVISRELIERISSRPRVRINALSLNGRTTLINYLTQAVNGKFMRRETAMEQLPEIEDTLAEFEGIIAEDAITNTDLLQAVYMPRSLYAQGDIEAWSLYNAIMLLTKLQELGMLPGGMAPPGGGGPPPPAPKGQAPIKEPQGQVANQAAAQGQGPGSQGAPVGRPG